jgi:acyl-CoA thioesterase
MDPDQLARTIANLLAAQEGTTPAWGLEIEAAAEGYARVAMTVRADMLNGYQTIHGGMVFALADSAFAYACNSRNQATVAQAASIAFLTPAREGERLVAEAREQSLVGRSGVYIVSVRTSDGRDVASFQGLSRTVGGPLVDGDPPHVVHAHRKD